MLRGTQTAELVLCVGTSFPVGVTQQVLASAHERRVPVFNVDPAGEELAGVALLKEPSERVLPRLITALAAGWP